MLVSMLKSKIAYAKVSAKDLYYVGSITIDKNIMAAANIIENEKVQVVNLENGERLETYVIQGEAGSNIFALNGPAARRCEIGDRIFILSYALVDTKREIINPIIINQEIPLC